MTNRVSEGFVHSRYDENLSDRILCVGNNLQIIGVQCTSLALSNIWAYVYFFFEVSHPFYKNQSRIKHAISLVFRRLGVPLSLFFSFSINAISQYVHQNIFWLCSQSMATTAIPHFQFPNTFHQFIPWAFRRKVLSDDCHKISLIRRQHLFW